MKDTRYRKPQSNVTALKPSERIRVMEELEWPRKVVVIEPILDFDLEDFVNAIMRIWPEAVYVGYDIYGNRLPEPPLTKARKLVDALKRYTWVHVKSLRPAWYGTLGRRGR
ncbi:MAG: hypothetical protein DRJ57_04800 [Thermoprotei archaeon]|nr:MAG: hypothetical protein DRJ57_04800 [Thermoprotei archaeon]